MKLNRTLFAAAALAAAPALAQTPPVQNRTEIPAPREGQVIGARAGGAQAPAAGESRPVARPVAGRSVPAAEVGAVGGQVATRPAAGARLEAPGVNDALFAAAAADSGLAELTLSQLGVQRATDPELKRFSRQMIDEHTRMNNELRAMCAQKGIRVPEMVDVRSQFCAQSLAGVSGEKFDMCYAKAQLVAHMDAVAAFEAEAERGLDPNMRALAAQALPKIKGHLEQIEPIARRYCDKEKAGSAEHHSRIGKPGGQPIR